MKKLFVLTTLIAIAIIGFSQNGDQLKNQDRNRKQIHVETSTSLMLMNQNRIRTQKKVQKSMHVQKRMAIEVRTGDALMRNRAQRQKSSRN